METLRDFLGEFFDDVQVSIYLRRQDQVALSLYSTRLKSGDTERAILPRTDADDPYFNYDRSLGALGGVLRPRRTSTSASSTGARSSAATSSPTSSRPGTSAGPTTYASVADQNESIRPLAQEFLRCVNTHLEPIDGLPIEEVRGPLAARLARLLPGRGARPARADAEAFYGKFRASNEAVRQRHFPDRATLFDEDFSGYPETEDRERLRRRRPRRGRGGAAHRGRRARSRRLEAEIAIRDARLHWPRDEPAAAERALQRALAWCPDHAEAYRTLAEYLLRLGRLDEARRRRDAGPPSCKPDALEYWHFLGVSAPPHRRLRRRGRGAATRRSASSPDHAAARRELDQLPTRLADRRTRRCAPTDEAAIMPKTTFSLSSADLAALDKVGLRLAGLRHTGRLADGSRIEAPTSIISMVAPGAFLDVGAFCNLTGGDQQRPLRALLLGRERRRHRAARAPDRLADHLAHRLLPRGERLGRAASPGRTSARCMRAGVPFTESCPNTRSAPTSGSARAPSSRRACRSAQARSSAPGPPC